MNIICLNNYYINNNLLIIIPQISFYWYIMKIIVLGIISIYCTGVCMQNKEKSTHIIISN